MLTRALLFAGLGGRHKFYRLRTAYKKARPQRDRTGFHILTADEVFRKRAKDSGFSDEQINMFIDCIDL